MLLRLRSLLIALLLLGVSSQVNAALFVNAPSASAPPSTSENASTAFLPNESESRIGFHCHNDPVNRSDPFGLDAIFLSQPSAALYQGHIAILVGNENAGYQFFEKARWPRRQFEQPDNVVLDFRSISSVPVGRWLPKSCQSRRYRSAGCRDEGLWKAKLQ